MNLKKTTLIAFILLSIFSLSSCEKVKGIFNKHEHVWENYIVKAPSCTQRGLLEKICVDCGQKEYEDIAISGHNYSDGKCTVCGIYGANDYENLIKITLPDTSNNNAAWDMSKIYETAKNFYKELTHDEFYEYFSLGYLTEAYVDSLGMFHITASNNEVELPLSFLVGKVSPINTTGINHGTIHRFETDGSNAVITYTNGLKISAGRIIPSQSKAETVITAFGLNVDNELVLYYSDSTIAFAGKISEGMPSKNQSNFAYSPNENGYSLSMAFSNDDSTVIKIPVSHKGKPITRIEEEAFIQISEKVTSIVIPDGIKLDPETFEGMNAKVIVYLEGKKSSYDFGFMLSGITVYEKGEWHYVNGKPVSD